MNKERINVLLADDTVIALEGWKAILATADDMRVVGEATSAPEAIRKVRDLVPDVVLMDLKWAGDSTAGWTAIGEIKRSNPQVKVIAITAYEDLIPDARRAGADGALLKTFTREQLLGLIRELASREESFPAAEPQHIPIINALSPRELEVLVLLADGGSDKEIAEALKIAESTAKNHVSSILSKLGAKNRTEATSLAYKRGLVS